MRLKESTPNQMLSISELPSSICSGEQSASIHNGPSNMCPRNNSNVCNGKQLKYSSDFVLNSSDSGSTLNSCNDLPFLNIIDERNLISASTNTVLNGRSEEDKGSLTGSLSGLFASSRHPNKSYADAIKAPSQSSDTRRSCWNNNSCITTDADININQANKDVWEKELSINTSTSKLQKTVSIDSPRSDEKNSKINASSGCNGTRGCSTEEEAAALYGKSNPKSKGAIPKIRGGQKTNNRRIDTNPIDQLLEVNTDFFSSPLCAIPGAYGTFTMDTCTPVPWSTLTDQMPHTNSMSYEYSSPVEEPTDFLKEKPNKHELSPFAAEFIPRRLATTSCDDWGADSSEALFADYIQCDSVPEPPQAVNDSQLLPPAESDYLVENKRTAYLFELPTALCGYLIGKKGYFVKLIRLETNAQVSVAFDQRPTDTRMVTIIGTESEIKAALEFLRERFPPNNYPTVSLEQVDAPLKNWPARLKISHPVKSSFELIVTSIVTANHFFVQIPTYPSYYQMDALYKTMSSHYSQIHTPAVYTLTNGDIVCAPFEKYWLRAVVVNYFSESDECEIKYLDMGGYDIKDRKSLRQINSGFMQIPFQGIECCLADVECVGNIGWTEEATMYFKSLVEGHVLRAIVAYYIGDAPCLYLYKFELNRQLFINQMLVNAGYLVWSPKE